MNAKRRKASWPSWWEWDLELTPHVEKRMEDRQFSEVDLRAMMEDARGYRANVVEGRWVIAARRGFESWEIIVEPDIEEKRLVVITAYPVEE